MKHKLQVLFFLLISSVGFSQILDVTFGNSGKVITPIGVDQDAINSVAIQSDGKIVTCGQSQEYQDSNDVYRTIVCRYNTDGSLDTGFGTNGKVIFPYLFDLPYKSNLKLQNDGKILIATNEGDYQQSYNFLLIRLNTNGSFDTSFGTNGVVITDFEPFGDSENIVRNIELQTDGKIILAGENRTTGSPTQYENFAIVRYNTDGVLDASFGNNGRVSINIGSNSVSTYSIDGIYAVKLQSNGKIILGGYTDAQNLIEVYNAALLRLNIDGTIDTTFGIDGKTITNIPGGTSAGISSLVINSDDTIIAGGVVNFNTTGNTKIGLMKYDINGNLDTAFGTNGFALTQVNTTVMRDAIWEMLLQPDGKILATGYSLGATIDMLLMRYTTTGALDSTFDSDGILLTDFGMTSDGAYSLLMQPDGKIVVGGLSGISPNYDFALARYTFENLNVASSNNTAFTIYPNPTSNVLTIHAITNAMITNAIVTDLSGKKIMEESGNINQLSVQNLQQGIYLLQLVYDGGKQIEKFIKQ